MEGASKSLLASHHAVIILTLFLLPTISPTADSLFLNSFIPLPALALHNRRLMNFKNKSHLRRQHALPPTCLTVRYDKEYPPDIRTVPKDKRMTPKVPPNRPASVLKSLGSILSFPVHPCIARGQADDYDSFTSP